MRLRGSRLLVVVALVALPLACGADHGSLGDLVTDTGTGGGSGPGGTEDGGAETNGTTDAGGSPGAESCTEDDLPPVIYYPFDECSDVTPEAMGTGLDAAMKQASCGAENGLSAQLGTTWSSGTALHCLRDEGAYAEAPDSPLFEPTRFTISLWVMGIDWLACGAIPPDGEPLVCSILTKGNTDEGNGYTVSVHFAEPKLTLAGEGGPEAERTIAYGSTLDTDVWYHLVATFDGETGTVYVDGVPGGSGTIGFPVTYGDEGFLIGGMVNRNFNVNGFVEEVKLWDCAKSATQVAALYDSYLAR